MSNKGLRIFLIVCIVLGLLAIGYMYCTDHYKIAEVNLVSIGQSEYGDKRVTVEYDNEYFSFYLYDGATLHEQIKVLFYAKDISDTSTYEVVFAGR